MAILSENVYGFFYFMLNYYVNEIYKTYSLY